MILVVITLSVLCVVSMSAFFYTAHLRVIEFAHAQQRQDIDHAHCIAHVAHYTGDAFAAQVLSLAADDFDSVEGQTRVRQIASSDHRLGGPSVPALWLQDRADQFIPHDTESEESS